MHKFTKHSFCRELCQLTWGILCIFIYSATASAQSKRDLAEMPDLTEGWQSTEGFVYWLGGYIGEPENALSGNLIFNTETGVWEFDGQWGRHENGAFQYKGDIKLSFNYARQQFSDTGSRDASTFSGHKWVGDEKQSISGSYQRTERGYNRAHYSFGHSPYKTANVTLLDTLLSNKNSFRRNVKTALRILEPRVRNAAAPNALHIKTKTTEPALLPSRLRTRRETQLQRKALYPCTELVVDTLIEMNMDGKSIAAYCRKS